MRRLRLFYRTMLFALCALFVLSAPSAVRGHAAGLSEANQPAVTEVSTVMGENSIRYPQLSGMADPSIQSAINDAIVEKAKIAQRMITLSTLKGGGIGLTVTYDAYLSAGVFSTVISAYGAMENGRSGQEYTALSYDLTTGNELTMADLFSDPDAAASFMETTLENTIGDDLSAYLVNASLSPLPTDQFYLGADGITFYYPPQQFSWLSGYSGAAQFTYDELTDYLITDPAALPARLGALPQTLGDAQIKADIVKAVTDGQLPHIPVKLGDAIADLVARYRLLRQPDEYPGGKYYQLEAPMFRQVLVLSDALTTGYADSKVQGVMSLRTNLYGIQTGVTSRARWRQILGEPDSSVAFDDDMAYDYGLPAGTADYYTISGRQLLLYADENDLLYAIRLTE